jgi:hypothetical protein
MKFFKTSYSLTASSLSISGQIKGFDSSVPCWGFEYVCMRVFHRGISVLFFS